MAVWASLRNTIIYGVLLIQAVVYGFTVPSQIQHHPTYSSQNRIAFTNAQKQLHLSQRILTSYQDASKFQLKSTSDSNVIVTNPTPENAAEMGIRDWPQQLKTGSWEETIKENETVVRYVLDGTGTLCIRNNGSEKKQNVGPGTLIEATGECGLIWEVKNNEEMIILTPTYEEGGTFLAVVVCLIICSIYFGIQ